MVKVKPNFHISNTIVLDFDQQVRLHHSANDLLRYQRDNKATKQMEAISVTDDGMTLGKDWPWASIQVNRQKKADLVAYLSKKLLNSNRLLKFYMSPSRVNCTKSPINTQSNTLSQTVTRKQIPGYSGCVLQ